MQCVEFEDRLNRLLDHRLSPDDDAQIVEHARRCESCAGMLNAQHRLFAGLRAMSRRAPADLADRVMARRHVDVQTRRAVWRNLGWTVLLASAAGLGGLAVMALKSREAGNNIANQPAPRPAESHVQQSPKGQPGLAATSIPPAASSVAPSKPDLDYEEYRRRLEDIATQISDSTELDEVGESLSPGIRPIQSSFGLAIDALRRTLPRGKDRPSKPDAGAFVSPDAPLIG